MYLLKEEFGGNVSRSSSGELSGLASEKTSFSEEPPNHKKLGSASPQNLKDSTRSLSGDSRDSSAESKGTPTSDELHEDSFTSKSFDELSTIMDPLTVNSNVAGTPDKRVSAYNPPDLNKNITEIFKKLMDIYRALGDDRRSFSYYKAIPVIEKLSFKIKSADQVKNMPGIKKSLRDHLWSFLWPTRLQVDLQIMQLRFYTSALLAYVIILVLNLKLSGDLP